MNQPRNTQTYIRTIQLLLTAVLLLLAAVVTLCIYISVYTQRKPVPVISNPPPFISLFEVKDTTKYWQAPDTTTLSNNTNSGLILYGRDLIVHTSAYFGSSGKVAKNAINGMNCQNCHLDAGTRVFGNNYGSVAATYPKYRARSGGIESIYKRVNDCFERSLNGHALDTGSREMQAITAYIKWLGKDVQKGKTAVGAGLKDIAFLRREASPYLGKQVYISKCQSCHQPDGGGQLLADKTGYQYPPLWGNNSYNDGAGLYRISNFAKYVRYNMPWGVHYDAPQLTDEEAWDVAAFVNSQPRPHKPNPADWPNIAEKPFDHPYGPYADPFSEHQHKYGPFQAIKAVSDSLKKLKKQS